MRLRVGSLFSGIGGLELGLERAGMRVLWQVENDDFCRRVLEKHWPDVARYEDVHDVGAHNLKPVDLICGGFPCQPVSVAGKRKGQDDERWLWPEFARIIRELRPRYALMENVPGLLVRGFGDVLGDLAALRYDAEWGCVSAASVGAPHLRQRVFVVAHAAGDGWRPRRSERAGFSGGPAFERTGTQVAHAQEQPERAGLCESEPRRQRGRRPGDSDSEMAEPPGERLEGRGSLRDAIQAEGVRLLPAGQSESGGENQWATEPNVGRVAHGVSSRVDRLRALGNAVVPQVSEYVGRRIMSAV